MVLVDTSIWIQHLHSSDEGMAELLTGERVVVHPLVTGELACGSMPDRDEILALLEELPRPKVSSHAETLAFIEQKRLWGVGLSYIDVHLLASALLSNIELWTADEHLRAAAQALGVAYA